MTTNAQRELDRMRPSYEAARREIDSLRDSLIAIAQWQCASCGCRFAKKPRMPVEMEGVTHCSGCVTNQILRHRLEKAVKRNAAFAVVQALQMWRDDVASQIYRAKAALGEAAPFPLCDLVKTQSAILALMQRPTGTKPPSRKKASKKAKR